MTGNKESNFISAVAYLRDDEARVGPFLQRLARVLDARCQQYEIILVNDASRDGSAEAVKQFVRQAGTAVPVTLVNMSLYQGVELCMNAGLDLAIGDFLYEFDSLDTSYDEALVWRAYETALTGYDIVSVGPEKSRSMSSRLFYRLFNATSASKYPIRTDAFRLVSRRALNRVHAVSPTPAYRKAAYAASGLKVKALYDKSVGHAADANKPLRWSLAIDSLILYTNAASKLSFAITGLMLLGTLAELAYTLAVYLGGGNPVAGWTTTMFVLTGGFFGVFLLLSIILKYLSLLIDITFRHQKYLVESVEKLQK